MRRSSSRHLGVVFDWDGVIVASTDLHALSWKQMAEARGTPLPAGLFPRIGRLGIKTEKVISDILGWSTQPTEIKRLAHEKEALYRRLVSEHGQPVQPGLYRLLERLKALAVPCAIGSSAPRLNIEACMDTLALRPFFQTIVTGDDVIHGKPAPDIYLEAARRIQRPPKHCVVFEDAPAGIAAARAAGMRIIALLTTNSVEALSRADRHIKSFEELTEADPRTWFKTALVA